MSEPTNATSAFDPLDRIIAEYLQALEAGAAPPRDEYLARHPEHAEPLRAFFRDFDAVGRDASKFRLPDPQVTATVGEGGRTDLPKVRYLGDYELLAEIARGGMGVVYRARQVSLNRPVALKMILAGTYATPEAVQRFRSEAEAAANLDHPNILPIYEVGEHDGHQYFSMKLVEGGSLAADVNTLKAKPKQVAELMATLARAVHFAHQRGTLHRDLKPANVLMDADGTPFITDFGLAKKVDSDDGSTRTGAVVGTPSYMAPEQARGAKGLTTAVDVYSLGAILYELLTGGPPFKGETVFATIKQVMETEPTDPRSRDASADRDLSVIALKCLHKDPARRYPSANELATDLDRWRNGEPIHARPTSALERGWKWTKRHPAPVALLATALLAVFGGLIGLALSNQMISHREAQTRAALEDSAASLVTAERAKTATEHALGELKAQQRETQAAVARWRQAAYVSDIALASNEWAGNRPQRALQFLDESPADLRGWEWHHLQRVANAAELTFPEVDSCVLLSGRSADGTFLITTDAESVQVRNATTGQVVRRFTEHAHAMPVAALSPDGKRVLSGSRETLTVGGQTPKGDLLLWETETGKVLKTFPSELGGITGLTFAPDGRHFATVGTDMQIRLWTADGANELHRWTIVPDDRAKTSPSVQFSPDGKQLAAGDATHRIWDVETKKELAKYDNESLLQFSPDGKRIATARGFSELVVRDRATGAETMAARIDTAMLTALTFSPDSKRVSAGGIDGIVRTFDIGTKNEVGAIRGQQGWCMGLLYSGDGTRLLTSIGDPLGELFGSWLGRSGGQSFVRVWDVARGQDYRVLATAKTFHPHPTRAEVAIAQGREIAFYHPVTGTKIRSYEAAPEEIVAFAIHPKGATIAVTWSVPPKKGKQLSPGITQTHPVKNPHRLQILNAETGKPVAEPHAQEEQIGDLAFAPDGSVLAATGWGKLLGFFDATGKALASPEGADGGVTRLAFGPNGRLYRATTGRMSYSQMEPSKNAGGVIEEWDWGARKKLRELKLSDGFCHALAVSADGGRLAAALGDQITLLNLKTEEQRSIPIAAHSLTFHADGQRLIAATPVGVKLFDVDLLSARELLTLGGKVAPGGNTSRVAFHASEHVILVNDFDGLRAYDGRPWTPPAKPVAKVESKETEPKKDPPTDPRSEVVRAAVGRSVAALDANEPGRAALHALAALEAETDPQRQIALRIRLSLALQMVPKLRPVVADGSREPSGFAPDAVADLPGTPNVCDPTTTWTSADDLLRSADGKRFLVWNPIRYFQSDDDRKKNGPLKYTIAVFDGATGTPLKKFEFETVPLRHGVALSQDGKRFAALFRGPDPKDPKKDADDEDQPAGGKNVLIVRVYDVETGKQIGKDLTTTRPSDHANPRLEFLPGGRFLVAKSTNGWSDSEVRQVIWDLETGLAPALPEKVSGVFGKAGDRFFVTAGPVRRSSQFWGQFRDAATLDIIGKPFETFDLHHVAFSADGKRIAMANLYFLGTWDATTGDRVHPRFHVYGGGKCIAITRDGSLFAAGFKDAQSNHFAQVWDGGTGDAVTKPINTTDPCLDLAFTSDNRVLVTCSEKAVRLWDARTGEPLTPLLKGDNQYGFTTGHPADAFVVGSDVFVRRNYETSRYDRWSVAPIERPVEELRELVQAVVGERCEANGAIEPIPAADLLAKRRAALARFPERFGTPIPNAGEVLKKRPDPRVPQLIALFDDLSRPARRVRAVGVMGELKDPSAQEALVRALNDTDANIRRTAAGSLGSLEHRNALSIRALVNALQTDTDPSVRAAAARAFAGPSAKEVTPQLLTALKDDKDARVRAMAAFALHDANPDDAVISALRATFVEAQPWEVRIEAARAVAKLLPDDTESVGQLVKALESADLKDTWSGTEACRYLEALGARAAPAAPLLAKIVAQGKYQRHYDDRVSSALRCLARMGPAAKPALPALLGKLGEDDANPHWYVVSTRYSNPENNIFSYTVAQIGADAVPELLKVFETDKDAKRRRAAVMGLGFMASVAKPALPKLEAEAKRLAAIDEKTEDEAWLAKALTEAVKRINDPAAVPIEKLLSR